MSRYTELHCRSDYSFLEGASCAEELFAQAALYGFGALAITDRNSLAGIVRAHQAAKETGVRLIVGCQLGLTDGTELLVYPTDRFAYVLEGDWWVSSSSNASCHAFACRSTEKKSSVAPSKETRRSLPSCS